MITMVGQEDDGRITLVFGLTPHNRVQLEHGHTLRIVIDGRYGEEFDPPIRVSIVPVTGLGDVQQQLTKAGLLTGETKVFVHRKPQGEFPHGIACMPLVCNVPHVPYAKIVNCPHCGERCWQRNDTPAGMDAACTRCALIDPEARHDL